MTEFERALADLHESLRHKPLNRTWAKLEILLGLLAAVVGGMAGIWAVSRQNPHENWSIALIGMLLAILGGYLALAGNRSHLYQSNNELIAYLGTKLQNFKA